MGNEHNQKIIILQGFAIPSMPMDIALMGPRASHNYCPTLTTFANLLVTLLIIFCTSECLSNIAYHLQQATPTHGHCLPPTIVPLDLQTTTFKRCPFFYYHILVVTFLWQPLTSYFKSYHLICHLTLLKKETHNYQGKGQHIWSHVLNGNLHYVTIYVVTLVLGSRPRQRFARLQAKREAWESHHMLLGMQKNVRE